MMPPATATAILETIAGLVDAGGPEASFAGGLIDAEILAELGDVRAAELMLDAITNTYIACHRLVVALTPILEPVYGDLPTVTYGDDGPPVRSEVDGNE